MLYLSTIGAAQADDPPHFATIYKRHVVQYLGFRSESNHSRLVVHEPVINPHQRASNQRLAHDLWVILGDTDERLSGTRWGTTTLLPFLKRALRDA